MAYRPGNGRQARRRFPFVFQPFSFTTEAEFRDGTAELIVRGDADINATSALAEMLTFALGKHPRHLVLDLSGVEFLDCAAAGVIADAAQALPPGRFTIRAPSQPAARLLELTDLAFLIEDAEPT